MLEKVKSFVTEKKAMVMCALVAVATSLALPMVSFASEADGSAIDVTTTLTSSFQSMADTMLKTVSATLPVVMSVMSAYLCINYGIKFFRRFAK